LEEKEKCLCGDPRDEQERAGHHSKHLLARRNCDRSAGGAMVDVSPRLGSYSLGIDRQSLLSLSPFDQRPSARKNASFVTFYGNPHISERKNEEIVPSSRDRKLQMVLEVSQDSDLRGDAGLFYPMKKHPTTPT
jgi:hypothetical protein